jgi:hypothetical protein
MKGTVRLPNRFMHVLILEWLEDPLFILNRGLLAIQSLKLQSTLKVRWTVIQANGALL